MNLPDLGLLSTCRVLPASTFDSVALNPMELLVKDSERLMVSTFVQDTKELVVEKGNAYHISPLANPEASSGELQCW